MPEQISRAFAALFAWPLSPQRAIRQFKQRTRKHTSSTPAIHRISRALFSPVVVYLVLVALVTLVLMWRFPNNVTYANYYAEDGSVFLQNILDEGWIRAIISPFNGYFVIGLYLLEAVAWVLNSVFGGGGLLTLSTYFALTSIMFMAAVICLPYPLLKQVYGKWKMLLVVIFGALLPLPLAPHVVIGTVGNQKWVFLYLAMLLVLYRVVRHGQLRLRTIIIIHLLLLICAYTNTAVYLLIPILLIPYLHTAWTTRKGKSDIWRRLVAQLKLPSCLSLVGLGLLLLPQLIYVALNGIPALPGYLDTPFQPSKAIELFINRTYLFGVTHLFNGYMNNALVIIIFVAIIAASWRLRTREKIAFFIALYTAGIASVLFALNRPGVTDFFSGYQPSGSGPDQFYYTQTLIMYLPIVLIVFAVARIFKRSLIRYSLIAVFSLFVIASGLVSNVIYGARWRNASVYENYAYSFIDQSIVACRSKQEKVAVVLYPYANGQFSLTVPRQEVCNAELGRYQLSQQDLGLQPNNNDYQTIDEPREFTQTFRASQNYLNGVRLFLSDFGNYRRDGDYTLVLYDAGCRDVIRRSTIPSILLDNTFYNARFDPIAESKGRTYCFTLQPPGQSDFSPLAIQKSAAGVYRDGVLTENNTASDKDIVFMPLYTQVR